MIRICTPYYSEYDSVKTGLSSIKDRLKFEFTACKGTYIDHARNYMITKSKSTLRKQPIVGEEFLFIDSDVIFTNKHINRVVELGKSNPVVFLPYKTHDYDNEYQCGAWSDNVGISKGRYACTSKGVHKINWCGAGFLYVKKEVFEAIEYPYFRNYVLDVGEHSVPVGEDFGFCIQLHKKGIPIVCDFDTPVGHKPRFKQEHVARYDLDKEGPWSIMDLR